MIKVLFLILTFLILQKNLFSQEYWINQVSPTEKNLNECYFTDTLNGWICGASGIILHTDNNGQNWQMQNSGIGNEIVSIFFVNKNTGYALANEFDNAPPNYNGTRILSTTNEGVTWNNYLYPDTNLFLSTIFFRDPLNGYMAGSGGRLFYTTNAGVNWLEGVIDSGFTLAFPIEKIKFYDANTGYASGGAFDLAGVMWKSTSGGMTWRTKVVGPEPVYDFEILDQFNVLGVGGDFEFGASFIRSTNGGADWQYNKAGYFGIANSVEFRTETEVWSSLGIVDSFMLSTDGGNSWTLTGTPAQKLVNDIYFVSSTIGWAVGRAGAILKYNSDLVTISSADNYLNPAFSLYQNYPNPFNPVTVISYSLNANSFVSLKIYDALGKETDVLIKEDQSAGSYNVRFDGSNLQSGIYFYRISVLEDNTNKEYFETRKMIILK